MVLTTQTQALIDELQTPSICSSADALAAFLGFLPTLGEIGEQHDRVLRLARMAQIGESDDEVRGQFEPIIQTYGALMRQRQDLDRCVGVLIETLRQAERVGAEVAGAIAAPIEG